jgi:hypothetical protein
MKRLHVHMSVEAHAPAGKFHSTLFASAPAVLRIDFAQCMPEQPRVSFAMSACCATAAE